MRLEDLAPWIAIAFTLALSILVPLFTQIANNNHQRKMQREKFEYEEKQKKIQAFEAFLKDVGSAIVYSTKENLEIAGGSIFRIYTYAPTSWMEDLDLLSEYMRTGERGNAAVIMQKLARLVPDELNGIDCPKTK